MTTFPRYAYIGNDWYITNKVAEQMLEQDVTLEELLYLLDRTSTFGWSVGDRKTRHAHNVRFSVTLRENIIPPGFPQRINLVVNMRPFEAAPIKARRSAPKTPPAANRRGGSGSAIVDPDELLARVKEAGWRTENIGVRTKVYPPSGPIIVMSRVTHDYRALRNTAALLRNAGLDIRTR